MDDLSRQLPVHSPNLPNRACGSDFRLDTIVVIMSPGRSLEVILPVAWLSHS